MLRADLYCWALSVATVVPLQQEDDGEQHQVPFNETVTGSLPPQYISDQSLLLLSMRFSRHVKKLVDVHVAED